MKKKLLITFMALMSVLALLFGLAGCSEPTVPANKVSLDKTQLTMEVGEEVTLVATVEPENATDKSLEWTVSPAGVVTVDNNGKVTAVGAGNATVKVNAVSGNGWEECRVTVNSHQITEEVWKEQVALYENFDDGTCKFTVEIYANDTLTQTVVYAAGRMLQEGVSGSSTIYTRTIDSFFKFVKVSASSGWVRETITEQAYTAEMETWPMCIAAFKNDFSAFTYADGVYTASSLDKTATLGAILDNVKITFDNNRIVSVEVEPQMSYSVKYVFKNFRDSSVTLPTNYTESNA